MVGVLADARTESLAEASGPQVYLSLYQQQPKDLAIFLRGQLDPSRDSSGAARAGTVGQSGASCFRGADARRNGTASLSERRFSMEMVGLVCFDGVASCGAWNLWSDFLHVSERTHEIGIRLALGAQSRNILRMVLREGLALAIAGAAVGAGLLRWSLSHLMAGVLYGVRPTDPLTFVGVALLLIGVALLACYFPARRAIRVDPLAALRHD